MSLDFSESEHQSGEIQLAECSEWRFEVPFKVVLKLKVVEGVAEIFGTELANEVDIRLTGAKYAVYAPLPGGCRLKYETSPNKDNVNISSEDDSISEYVSDESAMPQYTRLHFALEVKRQQAAAEKTRGPAVLVLGGAMCGKTTLVKVLAAYATKMDRTPLLVNLDPKQGVFSVPGSLTATAMNDFFDVEAVNGWGELTTLGATFHNPKQPLVKNFGFYDIGENAELYTQQASSLAAAIDSRIKENPEIAYSGVIIDTPPLTMKDVALVETLVLAFSVDVIVAVGGDRLAVDLRRKFQLQIDLKSIDIVKLAKAGGVADVDGSFLRKMQEDLIKEYFNGGFCTRLSPYKTDVDIKSFVVYKAVRLLEYTSQMAFLPSGDSYTAEEGAKTEEVSLDKFLVRLEEPNSSNLENSIVAITHVPALSKIDPQALLNTSVLGYAHVSSVDDTKQRMSLLLPFPGQIPRNVLIATDIGYTE